MKQAAWQVVDLAFGDSGKGTIVDYLVRREGADLVVRFNGGPQAGHNVVLPDGRHHTFSQFGSGSFVPKVKTLLSRYMLIEPYALLREAGQLESVGVGDILGRTFIDERCVVITPMHQVTNRLRERARGAKAHGTCGLGVGECVADSLERGGKALYASDLRDSELTRCKLRGLFELKRSEAIQWRSIATPAELRTLDNPDWIETAVEMYGEVCRAVTIVAPSDASNLLRETRVSIFEGAQGVLLDQFFGFHPNTTWSTTTFENADTLLEEAQLDVSRHRIGVCRSYLTRHGPGPFPTERLDLVELAREAHNPDDGMQGRFRRGPLDLVLLRYAIASCGGLDSLAVTHIDSLSELPAYVSDHLLVDGLAINKIPPPSEAAARGLQLFGSTLERCLPRWIPFPINDAMQFIDAISGALETRVSIVSRSPTHAGKLTLDSKASLPAASPFRKSP